MKYIAIVLALLAGCDDPNVYVNAPETPGKGRTQLAVEALGLRDVAMGAWALFACGDDLYGRHFSATNSNGARVSGVVCCGLLKGCTVRF